MVKRAVSPASLRGLDSLNFFLADVRDGIGPYLAIYLSTRGWAPARIGWAMSATGIATVAAQTPAGAFIDRTRSKRATLIWASIAIAVGSIAMVARPTFAVILASQTIIGLAATIYAPAVAAISLGLVGHKLFDRQMGRNEAFNHLGNVVAAVLAGVIGDTIAYEGIFYLVALMCLMSIGSTLLIRKDEIDDDLARGATDEKVGSSTASEPLFDRDLDRASGTNEPVRIVAIRELLKDRRIAVFAFAIVLFHFANAAMLPLVGQKLTMGHSSGAASYMSACIIAAQLVMVPTALLSSRLATTWGRKPTFLVGFAVLPIRGLLYTLTSSPLLLVAIQLLDGIGAGIFGVVGVLVIADLTRGTGRFNLMQGALAAATGIGASLSNLSTGYVVGAWGYNTGFLVLAAIAAAAFFFFLAAMPETLGTPHENHVIHET